MFRVGLLVPSSNTVMEPEFYRMAPQGVSVHSARIRLPEFTHEALVEALGRGQGGSGGVVPPYTDTLNRLKRRYLEAHGLTVSSIRGLGLSDASEIGAVEEEAVMPLVEEAAEEADVILIGCSSISGLPLIERVESRTGVPAL